MFNVNDLAKKLGVSAKTVRRRIKAEGIQPAAKKSRTLLFDQKAFQQLKASMVTNMSKHQAVIKAGQKSIQKTRKGSNEQATILDLLRQLSRTGETLSSDEYVQSVAEHVADLLIANADVNKIISLLKKSINQANLINQHHDQLLTRIDQLDANINHLYSRLVKNIRCFDYQQMAKINARAFLKLVNQTRVKGQ